MKKKRLLFVLILLVIVAGLCWHFKDKKEDLMQWKETSTAQEPKTLVNATDTLVSLENGLSILRYDGDYGWQGFLDAGGALSDGEVLAYLMEAVVPDVSGLQFLDQLFGCSTIQTNNAEGEALFGRNFDWEHSNALILQSNPKDAYASISTVNLDFLQSGASIPIDLLPKDVLAKVAMYAPLDGMNEKGLVVSVNMIQDADVIEQTGHMKNLTTTTAIRLLLNNAADVEEAVALLSEYNMHSSLGMMVHFAIADAQGNHVVVEYVNNEMQVIETPVVTNFYHSQGIKQNIGSSQSHERYDILMEQLKQMETMTMEQVRDALDSVSKDNFGEFESTEWSIVYNLNTLEVHYYHRENYDTQYVIQLNDSIGG